MLGNFFCRFDEILLKSFDFDSWLILLEGLQQRALKLWLSDIFWEWDIWCLTIKLVIKTRDFRWLFAILIGHILFPNMFISNARYNEMTKRIKNLNGSSHYVIHIHSSRDTANFDTAISRYWERYHNPSSPTTYFHISNVKNRECNLAGMFLLNCVIFHMHIFTEIHLPMWHVIFFKVSLALFILIVSTIVSANCVHGKVDLLIFLLRNFHRQDVNNLTQIWT